MILLICGGRECDQRAVIAWLNENITDPELADIECVVHGNARGADKAGGQWAREHGIPVRAYPAKWKKHGFAAGPIRNQQMLDEENITACVAFPGTTGTADMVARVKEAGIRLTEVHSL